MRHYNFFYATIVYSPSVSLYETNFPYEGGQSIVIRFVKLVYSEGMIPSVCF